MPDRRAIIIDTDPGQDDALAILLALASDEFDVLGITAVAGNVPLRHTVRNALRVRELSGRRNVPVYAGCPGPILRPLATAEEVHGKTGLDGVDLPEPGRPTATTTRPRLRGAGCAATGTTGARCAGARCAAAASARCAAARAAGASCAAVRATGIHCAGGGAKRRAKVEGRLLRGRQPALCRAVRGHFVGLHPTRPLHEAGVRPRVLE